MFRAIFPKLTSTPSPKTSVLSNLVCSFVDANVESNKTGKPHSEPSAILAVTGQTLPTYYSFESIEELQHETSEVSIDPFQSPLLKRSKSLSLIKSAPVFLKLGQRLKKSKSVHFDGIKEGISSISNESKTSTNKLLNPETCESKELRCEFDITEQDACSENVDLVLETAQATMLDGSRRFRLIPKETFKASKLGIIDDSNISAATLEQFLESFQNLDSKEAYIKGDSKLSRLLNEIKNQYMEMTTQLINLQNEVEKVQLKASSFEKKASELMRLSEIGHQEVQTLKQENSRLTTQLQDNRKQMAAIVTIMKQDPSYERQETDVESYVKKILLQNEDLRRQVWELNESFNVDMVKIKNDLYTLENELLQYKKQLQQIVAKNECSREYLAEDIEASLENFISDAAKWKICATQKENVNHEALPSTCNYQPNTHPLEPIQLKFKKLKSEFDLQEVRYNTIANDVEKARKLEHSLKERILALERHNIKLQSVNEDLAIKEKAFKELEAEHKEYVLRMEEIVQSILLRHRINFSAAETQFRIVSNQNKEILAELKSAEERNAMTMKENNNLRGIGRENLEEISLLKEKIEGHNARMKTLIKTNKTLVQAHATLISRCISVLRPFLMDDVVRELCIDHEKVLSKSNFSKVDITTFVRVIHLISRGISDLVQKSIPILSPLTD